ncbi:uncharacterized protein LOC143038648 isoform X2 [Oratosquilla oratoria]|uniref:uncharacterized protein LOC143038648 isoform X2 n=1 Tax=Oratosquilla oratoria TaxID=337810 RepID=UPI003F76A03C
MGRGTTRPGTSDTQNMPLFMYCESEGLSESQVNKFHKVQDDLHRLQELFKSSNAQIPGDARYRPYVPIRPLVNGTTKGSSPQSPPSGGRIGTRSQAVSPSKGNVSNGNAANTKPVGGYEMPKFIILPGQVLQASSANTVTTNAAVNTQVKSTPRSSGSTAASSVAGSIQSAKQAQIVNAGAGNTDIQVVSDNFSKVKHIFPSAQASGSGAPCKAGPKSASLLSVFPRPKNASPPAVAVNKRKVLDGKVKNVLVKSSHEFVEWLLAEGLIRSQQYCTTHTYPATQAHQKLKLGMFSDPKVLATSGGYVWISECCGKKYVSVYSGSIFGSTPIDKVGPTSVLKLIYHWACQTTIPNVETWVKVEKSFINKMYQYFRAICSVMLQEKVYDFGFDGTKVELGIVSLGTSTADGAKKAVRVEILGLFDRKLMSYRLFASSPEPGSNSRHRFIRILTPICKVVNKGATIICDQSVDRSCLFSLGFSKVTVCVGSENENNPNSNSHIMTYLRKHVPKMFQSSLSQLSLEQIQLFLDELCWRERFGHNCSIAYDNMLDHVRYLTSRELETLRVKGVNGGKDTGLLHLLEYVLENPQKSVTSTSTTSKGKGTSMSKNVPIAPKPGLSSPTTSQAMMQSKNMQQNKSPTPGSSSGVNYTYPGFNPQIYMPRVEKMVNLESYFYGTIKGDPMLGQEPAFGEFNCHLCPIVSDDNVEFMLHMRQHLEAAPVIERDVRKICRYCVKTFSTDEEVDVHANAQHLMTDTNLRWCRICIESYPSDAALINHMARKHCESELPYRCEVCNYATSFYHDILDHFAEQHKGSPYVQCPFCLNVKTLQPGSVSPLSLRMLQHMQKHVSTKGRCKFCALSFYSKYLFNDHKNKDHVSKRDFKDIEKYSDPNEKNPIMFKAKSRKTLPIPTAKPGPPSPPKNTIAMSATLQIHYGMELNINEEAGFKCIECDEVMITKNHYRAYLKCLKCSYKTSCKNMISNHVQAFHPLTRRPVYTIGPSILMPKLMYCFCGFKTRSGHCMANHLANCKKGKKTAFPAPAASSPLDMAKIRELMMQANPNLALQPLALEQIFRAVENQRLEQGTIPSLWNTDALDMSNDLGSILRDALAMEASRAHDPPAEAVEGDVSDPMDGVADDSEPPLPLAVELEEGEEAMELENHDAETIQVE